MKSCVNPQYAYEVHIQATLPKLDQSVETRLFHDADVVPIGEDDDREARVDVALEFGHLEHIWKCD